MPRVKPEISDELMHLRWIVANDECEDNLDNVELGRLRDLANRNPKWLFERKQKLEERHLKELDGWRRENRIRSARRTRKKLEQQSQEKVAHGPVDLGTAKCLEMLDKLIGELTGAKT